MQIKKVIILGIVGGLALFPKGVQAVSCANGQGTEVQGNDHGTYCLSHIPMNWWSAHAWCDAIGMQLIPLTECTCNDESKCSMTVACPNLKISGLVCFWTATPSGKGSANSICSWGSVDTLGRLDPNPRRAICMPR